MGSPSPPSGLQITIKPITSEADLPICAHLADVALKGDGLHEFKTRYNSVSVYQEALEKFTESLRDDRGRFRMFKAVVPSSSIPKSDRSILDTPGTSEEAGTETIVGFTQWRYGYVEVPKMDPFAPRKELDKDSSVEAGMTGMAIAEPMGQSNPPALSQNSSSVAVNRTAGSDKPKPFYTDPHEELRRKLSNAYIVSMRGKKHVCKLRKSSLP